jgi:hypothetical protein
MKKNVFAVIAVVAIFVLLFSTILAFAAGGGGRGAAGGGMGGARGGMAASAQRPDKTARLASIGELEKQIATLRAAIQKAPAIDPNVATLQSDTLTNFTSQYNEESNAISQIATTLNSIRPIPNAGIIYLDTLSEINDLAKSENATKVMALVQVLVKQTETRLASEGQQGMNEWNRDETGRYWRMHDFYRTPPKPVASGINTSAPPSNAIVLFDGKDLSKWTSGGGRGGGEGEQAPPATWLVQDGYYQASGGNLSTRQSFGSCQLHFEFATPEKVSGDGQQRGNGGWMFQGTEMQILDSYNNPTYSDGMCCSVYGRTVPSVNPAKKPGEWNSVDVIYHRPLVENGKVTREATFTIIWNGVLVTDHFEQHHYVQNGTDSSGAPIYTKVIDNPPQADKMPIQIQGRNPVRYRNVWIIELAD